MPSGMRYPIGDFHPPDEYADEWGCDLHSRSSPDVRYVGFDSTQEG